MSFLPGWSVLALLDHLPADRLHDEEEDVLAAAVRAANQLRLLDQLAQHVVTRSLLTPNQGPAKGKEDEGAISISSALGSWNLFFWS